MHNPKKRVFQLAAHTSWCSSLDGSRYDNWASPPRHANQRATIMYYEVAIGPVTGRE